MLSYILGRCGTLCISTGRQQIRYCGNKNKIGNKIIWPATLRDAIFLAEEHLNLWKSAGKFYGYHTQFSPARALKRNDLPATLFV